jgi:hypothetical protein
MSGQMKVLVACEFSGRVREAFAAHGHVSVSCDLLETELPCSKSSYHYTGDIRDIINEPWDLIIAHPPCTYLAQSGVSWLAKTPGRWEQMLDAVDFFNLFLSHPCGRICIENPIMHNYARQKLLQPDYQQKVQPYFFGHPERKATCLWLKNLPKLRVTDNVEQQLFLLHKADKERILWESPGPERQKNRSRTFQGIADAMASQWG